MGLYYTGGIGIATQGSGVAASAGPIISLKKRNDIGGVPGITSDDIAGYGAQGDLNAIPSEFGYIGTGVSSNIINANGQFQNQLITILISPYLAHRE